MAPPSPSSSTYEALFHAASVDLVIPEISTLPTEPDSDANGRVWEEWWTSVQSSSKTRTVAFLDERVYHYVGVTIPDNVLASPGLATPLSDEPPAELTRFIARLQVSPYCSVLNVSYSLTVQTTMTASFVPPLPDAPARPEPPPMTSSTLAPPSAHTPRQPQGPQPLSPRGDAFPPITPNPFPAMADSEAQYAQVEGVVVWEGAVELQPPTADAARPRLPSATPKPKVFRGDACWITVWRGEVPIGEQNSSFVGYWLTVASLCANAHCQSRSVAYGECHASRVTSAGQSASQSSILDRHRLYPVPVHCCRS